MLALRLAARASSLPTANSGSEEVHQHLVLPIAGSANWKTLFGKISEHFARASSLNVHMKPPFVSLPVLIALFPLPAPAGDQTAPATPASPERSSVEHPISSSISAAITAELPKYNPSVVSEKPSVSSDGVVQMPKFFVYTDKVPAFPERDLYSKAGFAELLRKKYPGASVRGQDPDRIEGNVPNYGALLYAEDKRLSQLKHFRDIAETLLRVGDVSGSKELNAEIRRTFARQPDTLIDAMDKSANNGRR